MTDFMPPPCFTTLRVCNTLKMEEAMETLENYVNADLNFRKILCRDISVERHPVLRDLLLVNVKKLETTPKYTDRQVIVDTACGVAVLRGAHVFLPGVIGAPSGLKSGDPVSVFVDLKKKCLKGSHKFDGQKYFIGNGIMRVSRNDIFASSLCVGGVAVIMNEPIYLTPCLDINLLPTNFFPQNLPSVVVGHVFNPPKNSIVLDMCAAPGGKATHLSSIMHNTGKIIALDRSGSKIEKIQENARRLNCDGRVFVYCADSRAIVCDNAVQISDRTVDYSPPYAPMSFFHILLDAPCSALGQRPKFPTEIAASKNKNISSYPSLQWNLVKCAVKLLAVGGTLVYSTCTTTYEENEGMVERILQQYSDIVLVKQSPHIGGYGRKEACSLNINQLEKLQYFDMTAKSDNTHPADNDTIGFFIAKFMKTGNS